MKRAFHTVHLMKYGHTACNMEPHQPCDWPPGHGWASDWADVTCPVCLAGKDIPPTFAISADGKSITCLRCHSTSYNPKDVAQHYCGRCKVFHDDLWPPARRWWLTHDNQGRVIPTADHYEI
jgi:hypothetical protein